MPIEINGVRVELIDAILIKRKSGRKPGKTAEAVWIAVLMRGCR